MVLHFFNANLFDFFKTKHRRRLSNDIAACISIKNKCYLEKLSYNNFIQIIF